MVVEITETYRNQVAVAVQVVVELVSGQVLAVAVHKVLTVVQVAELEPTVAVAVALVRLATLTAMALVEMEVLLTPLGA